VVKAAFPALRNEAMAEISNEALKRLVAAVGQAQGFNQANSFILMEVVCDLARLQPDPEKYLAAMFERVSARGDQGPIEKEAHPAIVEFRYATETFFALAGKRFRKRGRPPSNAASRGGK
jgi:hypothetical protein